ncbi:MAG: arylsulfatase B [Myxococcota bacterium]|jgi:arylsulfatase B
MLWCCLLLACAPSSGPKGVGSDSAAPTPPSMGGGSTSAGTPTPGTTATPAALPPNVLLVVLDDVGVDKLATYAAPVPPPTPTLDALAAGGVRFANAWSYAVCTPSRAALLTGRYGRRTGTSDHIITARDSHSLSLDEVTLPELLAHAPDPWATALLGKWHLTGVHEPEDLLHPLAQGFDHYAGHMENLSVVYDAPGEAATAGYFRWQKNTDGVHAFTDLYATTDTVEDVLAWVADAPEPWFVTASFAAPHSPYHVPPARFGLTPEPGAELAWMYDAMLTVADAELGRLLDGLGEQRERTLVIALGDNGTPWEGVRPPHDPARAKSTVAEGGIHVPLIVSGPGIAPGVSEALVHLVDVWPTLAEVAEVDLSAVPTAGPVDGRSLWPQLRDPATPGREFAYTERLSPNGGPPYNRDIRVIRDARYKLVQRIAVGDVPTWSLHDLTTHLEDGPDLYSSAMSAEHSAAFDRLSSALDAQLASFE